MLSEKLKYRLRCIFTKHSKREYDDNTGLLRHDYDDSCYFYLFFYIKNVDYVMLIIIHLNVLAKLSVTYRNLANLVLKDGQTLGRFY